MFTRGLYKGAHGMNPTWIAPSLAVGVIVINALWSAANIVMDVKITRRFAAFQSWAERELVSEKICAVRRGQDFSGPALCAPEADA